MTFDVFDTLVRRTLPHPDYTKLPAAKRVFELLPIGSPAIRLQDVLESRLRSEWELRLGARSEGHDPECHIEDVFELWLEKLGIEPVTELVQELLALECKHEFDVAYASPGMPELVRELTDAGIKACFLSDMYLSGGTVGQILDFCGYKGLFDRGYVSSQTKIAKYSGRAFQRVLQDFEVSAGSVLHVGDGLEADIEGAQKAGIEALHFSKPDVVKQHNVQTQIRYLEKRHAFWKGAAWCDRSIASPSHLELIRSDPVYRIGFEYLGPLFSNFMERVIEKLQATEPDLIMFNAREGCLLREIYQRLLPKDSEEPHPPSIYTYLSRKAIYPASLTEFTSRELKMGFFTTAPTIRNFFQRFSLPLEHLTGSVSRAGFKSLDERIRDPLKSRRLARLVRDPEFLSVVESVRGETLGLLQEYLEMIGFWGRRRVAMVDVGWNGTTQDALVRAISKIPGSPHIDGYYLALKAGMVEHEVSKTSYFGIFHDYRTTAGGSFFYRYLELFETACRAPHPTAIGLRRRSNGAIEPVFKEETSESYRAEQRDDPFVATLQTGVLDYCDDYVRTKPFHHCAPEEMSAFILGRLDRLIRYPTRQEAQLLGAFSHSEDFGQSIVYSGGLKGRSGALNSNEEQIGRMRQRTLWSEGTVAQLAIPGLLMLFNVYRLFRRKCY